MISGIDHGQLAMLGGQQAAACEIYGDLPGMTEIPKPPALASRGGCWFGSGAAVLHLGVEEPFAPARKAHPAFLVEDLDALRRRLTDAGHDCVQADGEIAGVWRFHTHDALGNCVEFQQQ